MTLKTRKVYYLECDFCYRCLPDKQSGYVGWDTTDGLDAELAADYEWWGVTEDGRHCCGECAYVPVGVDGYVSPDAKPLHRLTHVEARMSDAR